MQYENYSILIDLNRFLTVFMAAMRIAISICRKTREKVKEKSMNNGNQSSNCNWNDTKNLV